MNEPQITAASRSHGALDWIESATAKLKSEHLFRQLVDREGPQTVSVQVAGTTLTNFGSNDYLALANHPAVCAAAQAAMDQFGWGSGASPLILGHSTLHRQLERRLAAREQAAAALVFPTGYAANVGTIVALAGQGDLVFSDAKNHASIIDGCRLSAATIMIYDHADVSALGRLLAQSPAARRKLIVTDGLFSMDGDVAPLADLATLAEAHGAMLMVDEAHATGVLGTDGRGACELAGIEAYAGLVRTGTLSKALGSLGGFAIGSQLLIDWLLNRCRSYIFSTAAPAAVCAAAIAAIDIEQRQPQRRQRLLATAQQLRHRLRADGWKTNHSCSQIIPVVLGDAARAMQVSRALRQRNLLVPGIRPPSVPEGEALLRISLTSEHTAEMMGQLVAALRELRTAW